MLCHAQSPHVEPVGSLTTGQFHGWVGPTERLWASDVIMERSSLFLTRFHLHVQRFGGFAICSTKY